MKHRLIAASLACACTMGSATDYYTGQRLLQLLELDAAITARGNRATPDEGFDSGLGVGYIVGLHDAVEGTVVCAPAGTTIRQMVTAAHSFLRALPPARLSESADYLVVEGLRRMFPCPTRGS